MTFLTFLTFVHIIGCFWIFIAKMSYDDFSDDDENTSIERSNWLIFYKVDKLEINS